MLTPEVSNRSQIHDTTVINGQRVPDPDGPHITVSWKSEKQLEENTHATLHGYVPTMKSFDLKFAKAAEIEVKDDDTEKGGGKVVWPAERDLVLIDYMDHGHPAEDVTDPTHPAERTK
jgi:hypothetical protein